MMRLATVGLGAVLVLVTALTLRGTTGGDVATASPTAVVAAVPTSVATVVERFRRSEASTVTDETGRPLGTAGPPRGARRRRRPTQRRLR